MGGAVLNLEVVGQQVPAQWVANLRRKVAQLLGLTNSRFPGAQPVSFSRNHLLDLQKRSYFVCEKSDGVRCLLFLSQEQLDNGVFEERTYLIDRKNEFYYVQGLHFPIQGPKKETDQGWDKYHVDTILDGELLYDTYPGGMRIMKYLVFDCLTVDGVNMMPRALDRRLAKFHEHVLDPYNLLWKFFPKDCEPFVFRVQAKKMERPYGVEMLLKQVIPELKHGNDGLIFTCAETPYQPGTDENILKWKPAEENTIDFKLELRFPEINGGMSNGDKPDYDYEEMPKFILHLFGGDKNPDEEAGELHVEPAEWAAMQRWAVEQDDGLDGQITECHQDTAGRWRFNRFRDDKQEANHVSVAAKVLDSIEDGVGEGELIAAAGKIRAAWKEREAAQEAERKRNSK